jgi:HAD superfamily hydrolase (TIGR01549 family)
MKPLNVKSFVFDLGGTLYGALDPITEARGFLQELGLNGFSDDLILHSTQLADAWLDKKMLDANLQSHWEPSHEEWFEYDRRVLSGLGVGNNLDDYAAAYQKKWNVRDAGLPEQLIEGCKAVLKELQSRGYRLGVVSNRWGPPLPYLERDGIVDLFESIEYSNVPGYRKPSPYMLVQVASQLGVNPIKVAYVGNKVEFDVIAAQRAGAAPVLLAWGSIEEESKAPTGTIIIRRAAELLELAESKGAQKPRGKR